MDVFVCGRAAINPFFVGIAMNEKQPEQKVVFGFSEEGELDLRAFKENLLSYIKEMLNVQKLAKVTKDSGWHRMFEGLTGLVVAAYSELIVKMPPVVEIDTEAAKKAEGIIVLKGEEELRKFIEDLADMGLVDRIPDQQPKVTLH